MAQIILERDEISFDEVGKGGDF